MEWTISQVKEFKRFQDLSSLQVIPSTVVVVVEGSVLGTPDGFI